MAELTVQQREAYWRYNVRLTVTLLAIWFVVTYVISGVLAGWFNQFSFLGFPVGYYMAAQGFAGDLRDRDRRVRLPDEPQGSRIRDRGGGVRR
jgi:hypothetical protein